MPLPPISVSAPPPPLQRVIAAVAVEDVGAGIAGQGVGVGGAVEVLDAGQRVALRGAARSRAGDQVDRHAGAVVEVGRGVVAGPAVERVGAAAALEPVVAAAAGERIVVRRRPSGCRRRHEPVRFSMLISVSPSAVPPDARAGEQVDRHAGRRSRCRSRCRCRCRRRACRRRRRPSASSLPSQPNERVDVGVADEGVAKSEPVTFSMSLSVSPSAVPSDPSAGDAG